jgi:hypothetical protein
MKIIIVILLFMIALPNSRLYLFSDPFSDLFSTVFPTTFSTVCILPGKIRKQDQG